MTKFTISSWGSYLNTYERNKQLNSTTNITANDLLLDTCIRYTLFRLLKYPIDEAVNILLGLRSELGNAIHKFIQMTYPFTKTEYKLVVPDLRVAVRVDALIDNNVLVEIKSTSLKNLINIIRTKKPINRHLDQCIVYKYLLEKYDSSISNIDLIQIIYVANDIYTSTDDIETIIEQCKNIRKLLKPYFNNILYFTEVIDIDVKENEDYIRNRLNTILDKLSTIHRYLDSKSIPPLSNKYVNRNYCFLCPYKVACANKSDN